MLGAPPAIALKLYRSHTHECKLEEPTSDPVNVLRNNYPLGENRGDATDSVALENSTKALSTDSRHVAKVYVHI